MFRWYESVTNHDKRHGNKLKEMPLKVSGSHGSQENRHEMSSTTDFYSSSNVILSVLREQMFDFSKKRLDMRHDCQHVLSFTTTFSSESLQITCHKKVTEKGITVAVSSHLHESCVLYILLPHIIFLRQVIKYRENEFRGRERQQNSRNS